MQQLELNKTYTTLGGHQVTITNYDEQYRHPFFGLVRTQTGEVLRPCSFSPWGFYSDVCTEYNISNLNTNNQ